MLIKIVVPLLVSTSYKHIRTSNLGKYVDYRKPTTRCWGIIFFLCIFVLVVCFPSNTSCLNLRLSVLVSTVLEKRLVLAIVLYWRLIVLYLHWRLIVLYCRLLIVKHFGKIFLRLFFKLSHKMRSNLNFLVVVHIF